MRAALLQRQAGAERIEAVLTRAFPLVIGYGKPVPKATLIEEQRRGVIREVAFVTGICTQIVGRIILPPDKQ